MIISKENMEALHKSNKEYMWEHNPHLRKNKKFKKICGK
jgi:hypothetical protein